MEQRADVLMARATFVTGCQRPFIALNELSGARTPWPLTSTAEQYRANVLRFMKHLVARGARPALLVAGRPYTEGEAAEWWRQVGEISDVVLQRYSNANVIWRAGAVDGSRKLRELLSRLGDRASASRRPGVAARPHDRIHDRPGRRRARGAEAALALVRRREVAGVRLARDRHASSGSGTCGRGAGRSATRARPTRTRRTRRASGCGRAIPSSATLPGRSARSSTPIATRASSTCPQERAARTRTPCSVPRASRRSPSVTGDRELALTALLVRAVESARVAVSSERILAAEQRIVTSRFRGSRAAYRAALREAGAGLATARGIIGDELRRLEISRPAQDRPPAGGRRHPLPGDLRLGSRPAGRGLAGAELASATGRGSRSPPRHRSGSSGWRPGAG